MFRTHTLVLQVGQLKSVPKHVRLGKYGTINAGSNFLYTYILGEARRKC